MSILPCEQDVDAFDPHTEITRLEDELAADLGAGRSWMLAEVLRAVIDNNENPAARAALDRFLEV